MTSALPPYVEHFTAKISPRDALAALTDFLEVANNNAAYRPDSTLSERGPVSSSTSGNPNLVLHHLNRIKLGLEGVRVGSAQMEAEDALAEESVTKKRKRDEPFQQTPRVDRQDMIPPVTVAAGGDEEPTIKATEEEGGEWEDKDNYELAQDEEEVDMSNDRDPAGGLNQPANAQEAADMMEVEDTQLATGTPLSIRDPEKQTENTVVVDKEERKRLKKLKQQQERKKAEGEGNARSQKDKKSRT